MINYELKKVFSKRSSHTAMIFLGVLLVLVLHFMLADTEWITETGETVSGLHAVKKLKEAEKEWSGMLTEEKIARVISENNRTNTALQSDSDNLPEVNDPYSLKQGFMNIAYIINSSYSGFQVWSYDTIHSLTPERANEFYPNRIANLKNWLSDEDGGADDFSDKEKDFLVEQYENMNEPIYYDYQEGWRNLIHWAVSITMITAMVLGLLCAGIFSDEFRLKSSAVLYSSYHGRQKVIQAKLIAGFLIITFVYWGMMLLYSVLVLGIYGIDGANCPIQSSLYGWKSLYNITNGREYFLILIGGYIGCLFMTALVMLVSAATKSSTLAVIVPFVLIFLPSFISGINTPMLNKIIGLMPDRLLAVGEIVNTFNLYELGGRIIDSIPILMLAYLFLSVPLFAATYQIYKRKQII